MHVDGLDRGKGKAKDINWEHPGEAGLKSRKPWPNKMAVRIKGTNDLGDKLDIRGEKKESNTTTQFPTRLMWGMQRR